MFSYSRITNKLNLSLQGNSSALQIVCCLRASKMWTLGRPFSRWVTLNKCLPHRAISTNEDNHTTLHSSYEQVLLLFSTTCRRWATCHPFPYFSEPPSFLSMSSNGSLSYSLFTTCELQNLPPLHLRQGLGWPDTHYVPQVGLRLAVFLPPQSIKCWDDRNVLLCSGTALKAWIASYFLACNHSVQSLL